MINLENNMGRLKIEMLHLCWFQPIVNFRTSQIKAMFCPKHVSSSGVKNNGLKTTFMTDFQVLNGKIEVKKYVCTQRSLIREHVCLQFFCVLFLHETLECYFPFFFTIRGVFFWKIFFLNKILIRTKVFAYFQNISYQGR